MLLFKVYDAYQISFIFVTSAAMLNS